LSPASPEHLRQQKPSRAVLKSLMSLLSLKADYLYFRDFKDYWDSKIFYASAEGAASNSIGQCPVYNIFCLFHPTFRAGLPLQLIFAPMQNSIQIKIPVTDAAINDLLIAQLSELGYDGFEENDGYLLAFCNEDIFDEAALQDMLAEHGLGFEKTTIAPQNWNEIWESSFEPVVLDNFVGVRAGFHQPIKDVAHEIVITPKMSFGTGHHATTWLVMEQMQALDFKGKSVFDFGTGTGILAILAQKLGAGNIAAIDIDEWSITNAVENFATNGCAGIHLQQAETPEAIAGDFDVILANINKNILLQYIPALAKKLNEGGYLLLSGLLAEDEQDILLKTAESSLNHINTTARDKWISILLGFKIS